MRRSFLFCAALLIGLAAACAKSEPPKAVTQAIAPVIVPPAAAPSTHPLATWAHRHPLPPDAVPACAAAALDGPLKLHDGCMVIGTGTSDLIVPLFPKDRVKILADGTAFEFDGAVYRPGDTIRVGGGHVSDSPQLHSDVVIDMPGCGLTTYFVVC